MPGPYLGHTVPAEPAAPSAGRRAASVPCMAELLVRGDLLLASSEAAPLPRGAVLIRDGAIVEVGDGDAMGARTRTRRSSVARASSCCPG